MTDERNEVNVPLRVAGGCVAGGLGSGGIVMLVMGAFLFRACDGDGDSLAFIGLAARALGVGMLPIGGLMLLACIIVVAVAVGRRRTGR